MKKLYLTTTPSFQQYVIAENYEEATQITEKYYGEKDYGFAYERKVVEVKLIATTESYETDNNLITTKKELVRLLDKESIAK